LVVEAASQQWAREITRSSSTILQRLKMLLGRETVDRIIVREP
jgi:Dna[CI] antecedent, DciA